MIDQPTPADAEWANAVEIPIDGTLDLHQFRPADASDVVGDYLDECRERGILEVRVVHGKGKGVLRRIVHARLQERDDVVSFALAKDGSGWGATMVKLSPPPSSVAGARGRGEGVASLLWAGLLCAALTVAGCAAEAPLDGSADGSANGSAGGSTDGSADEAATLAAGEGEPEVTSLLGVPLYRPLLPDERRAALEDNLRSARLAWEAAPDDEDAIIWYGRRLAYLSRYNEAIEVYTRGIEEHPESFKLLRHRGHRYISTRQLGAAVDDLRRAAELAAAAPLEIEPDGAPNEQNIPLSNIHFNIWYHLGLAYYLQGDFAAARDAYLQCMTYSDNADLLVATTDWLWMSYRRLGDDAAAAALLAPIDAGLEIIENESYHRRLLMYKGEVDAAELLDVRVDNDPDVALNIATQGYGVGNWHLVNGDPAAATRIFERIVEGTSWAAFGYIAAEAELARDVSR